MEPHAKGFSTRPVRGLPEYLPACSIAARAPHVVVGLGNEIARDDGVGIAVARELERRLAGRRGGGQVEVVALPWAGFALLDVLVGRRRAALIDCLVTGDRAPGTIVRLDPPSNERAAGAGAGAGVWRQSDVRGSVRLNSFHDIAFPTALALGRDLGWPMPGEVAIWAIEAAEVDRFGEGLSTPVAAAVDRVANEVLGFVAGSSTPDVGAHPSTFSVPGASI